MLRPGKSSSSNGGLPNYSGGSYSSGGYDSGGYTAYNSGGGYDNQSYGGYSSGYPVNGSGYHQTSSQPQSLSSPRRNAPESPFLKLIKSKWFWTLLVCFLLCGSTLHYRNEHKSTLEALNVKSSEEVTRVLQDMEQQKQKWRKDNHVNMHAQQEYKKRIETLLEDNRRVTKERDELRIKYEEQQVSQNREVAMQHQISLLQNATSRESKRAVLEKFGQGPHRVMLTLKIPNGKQFTLENIVVEMAPLDLVPHAIHLFLEQVSHKLWDGTYIYLNGPHVMQSGPQNHQNDKGDDSALQKFIDQKLDKLAFPEYSPDFPHLPYVSYFLLLLL